MKAAATSMEKSPKPTRSFCPNGPWPAAAHTCCARRMARKAQLSSAPESKAEITEGDSLWASGSQVCRGASPILVP